MFNLKICEKTASPERILKTINTKMKGIFFISLKTGLGCKKNLFHLKFCLIFLTVKYQTYFVSYYSNIIILILHNSANQSVT